MRGRWLLMMLGLVLGASVALDAQQSGTTVSRPGTVPQGGVTGPRDMPRPSKGTARLRGLVVGGENGGPLRRAMVQLSGDGLQEGRATTTNEEGRWEIRDLPAGRYQITANKAGYVSLNYGQRRPFEQGKPLELRDGQTVENVNFNLPRGSAISGRVTDEFGEPVADVMISAQRYRYIGGRRRLTPVSRPASTDDGGNFRLYGLAPGDYYLSAAPMGFSFGQSSDDGTGYAPTYYPGTASAQQADKVTVAIGDEVSGLVFSLVPTRTAKITGTAVDSRGRPMAGAFVSVIVRQADNFSMSMGAANQVRDDGTFTLSDVGPGDYTIQVQSISSGPPTEIAMMPITITGEDLIGLALVGTRGTAISGRVVVDGAKSDRSIQPASFGIVAMPKEPGMEMTMYFGGESSDRLHDDWTFGIRAMTSPVLIRPTRVPPGYTLKQVVWRGQDVTDSGLAFKGDTVTDVEVVITAQSTRVTGSVLDTDGKPAADYVVVAFAEDDDKWGWQSRHMALARPDQQGGFLIKGLPAGRYLAVALPFLEEGEQADPEVLERLRGVATPFALAAGEQKTLTLKVVEQ
jgi:protocatechuate 3,4-dioxygenase beta subunit